VRAELRCTRPPPWLRSPSPLTSEGPLDVIWARVAVLGYAVLSLACVNEDVQGATGVGSAASRPTPSME
jgi:hypothetical protein